MQIAGVDPPAEAVLAERVARVEEQVRALDRVYREKVEVLSEELSGLREEMKGLRRWIEGTAVVLALQVLGLVLYALAGRAG